MNGGPSDKAKEAAARGHADWEGLPEWQDSVREQAATLLDAAHDPALGLDRSVCLRDVVEASRTAWCGGKLMAEFLEQEFGGDA